MFEGDDYGRNHCLTHDKDEPMIEFYDMDSGAGRLSCVTLTIRPKPIWAKSMVSLSVATIAGLLLKIRWRSGNGQDAD